MVKKYVMMVRIGMFLNSTILLQRIMLLMQDMYYVSLIQIENQKDFMHLHLKLFQLTHTISSIHLEKSIQLKQEMLKLTILEQSQVMYLLLKKTLKRDQIIFLTENSKNYKQTTRLNFQKFRMFILNFCFYLSIFKLKF